MDPDNLVYIYSCISVDRMNGPLQSSYIYSCISVDRMNEEVSTLTMGMFMEPETTKTIS